MRLRFVVPCLTFILCGLPQLDAAAQVQAVGQPSKSPVDAAGIEFFEKKVRPVLAQQCYQCHSHGAKNSLGGLFLDSRKGMLTGGAGGTILTPSDPDKSRLIAAVRYSTAALQMPPKTKLPDSVIADLTEWVKMGAPWPEEKEPGTAIVLTPEAIAKEKKKRAHWAFQPVKRVSPPAVKQKTWAKTGIDAFVIAKMAAKGLTPAPQADRRTLIRRAYFDLIGLPPSPEEVETFIADKSPEAWPKVIDHLLADPHYGERWGRFWLDVARYGEDQAHTFDARMYPQGFRYRDWVAKALNADMGYDRFVKEQIAADLMDEPDMREQLPALGMFAAGPVYYGDEKMFDQYDDRIDTLARGFLGLTAACARCHDHKFDPISQKDYYGLAGVFASTSYIEVPLGDPKEKFGKAEAVRNRQDMINASSQQVDTFLNDQGARLRTTLTGEISRCLVAAWKLQNRRKTTPNTSAEQVGKTENVPAVILDRWVKYLAEKKDKPQLAAWQQVVKQQDPAKDLSGSDAAVAEVRKAGDDFQNYVLGLIQRRDGKKEKASGVVAAAATDPKANASAPLDKTETAVLDEIAGKDGVLTVSKEDMEKLVPEDSKPRLAALKAETDRIRNAPFIHALKEGGKIANVPVLLRGNAATPGEEAPRHFLTILAGDNAPLFKQGSGRLELANAIADKNNPLTARVIVNRIWQHHFGRGIVRTTSNFGLLGEPPTHPELLDYLAAQLMDHGWSMKSLHRQIMLSATYQMSADISKRGDEVDPDDQLLWHMPVRRLEVEAWRDSMLSVSGKLDPAIGGPAIPLSDPNNVRRTYYASVSRHDLDSMLRLFDFPDPNVTADSRTTTTVPLQQLFVLNSEFMIRQAKAFAARLNLPPGETDMARIKHAYQLAYNRNPNAKELAIGLAFLQGPKPVVPALPGTPGDTKPQPEMPIKLTRWEQYAQALLSASEFMYVD